MYTHSFRHTRTRLVFPSVILGSASGKRQQKRMFVWKLLQLVSASHTTKKEKKQKHSVHVTLVIGFIGHKLYI